MGSKALSEVVTSLLQLKCAVGQKCAYPDKKSLLKGKLNPAAKKKILSLPKKKTALV